MPLTNQTVNQRYVPDYLGRNPVGLSSPAEAASIVSQTMQAGFDPLELARLRGARQDELRNRLAGDFLAGDMRDATAAHSLLGNVESDITADPDTGAAAHKQIADTEDALREASLIQRPEIGDAAKTVAERNAFARFLDAQAPMKAAISPEGEQSLNEASRRRIAEARATGDARQKLTAEGQKTADALSQAVVLGNRLRAILRDPNTELGQQAMNPDRSGTGQVLDIATSRAKRWAYAQGLMQSPPEYNTATQLAEQLKVIASRGFLGGIRNMAWIDQIQDHLAQGRLPPAANLERLENFLETAPELQDAIYRSELDHERLQPFDRNAPIAPRTGQPLSAAPPPPSAGGSGAYGSYQDRQAAPPAGGSNADRYRRYLNR